MLNKWTIFDKTIYHFGRKVRKLSRNGNGRIRVVLACVILASMILYPFWKM